jgi:4a-hydroxytetrahydrobiopterin dehydratase
MPRRLDAEEITRQLADLDGWSGDGSGLHRTVEAADFPEAIRIVDDIAVAAEDMNHHPDIDIRWRTLHLSQVTHAANGVTQLDIELCHRIDEIIRGHRLAD